MSPARLITIPEACLPASTVPMWAGAMPLSRSHRSCCPARLPVLAVSDPVERIGNQGQALVGCYGKIDGGPVIVFISGRLATIRGLVGSRMSMIDTVSLPAAWRTVLAGLVERYLLVVAGDQELRPGTADRRKQCADAAPSASSRKKAFIVSSIW